MKSYDARLQRLKSLARMCDINKKKHMLSLAEARADQNLRQQLLEQKRSDISALVENVEISRQSSQSINPTTLDMAAAYLEEIEQEAIQLQLKLDDSNHAYIQSLRKLSDSHLQKKLYEKKSTTRKKQLELEAQKKAVWELCREKMNSEAYEI